MSKTSGLEGLMLSKAARWWRIKAGASCI